jgi:hypothetical protein
MYGIFIYLKTYFNILMCSWLTRLTLKLTLSDLKGHSHETVCGIMPLNHRFGPN